MKNKKFITIFVIILTVINIFSGCKGGGGNKDNNPQEAKSLQNTVVFLTFEKEGSNFLNGFIDDVYKMYETTTHSVKNYFLKQSKGKLILQTQIVGGSGSEIIRSSKPVDYYKPRYKWINGTYEEINPQGYDNRYFNNAGEVVKANSQGALPLLDGFYREQSLIREILSKLQIPSGYNGDLSGDGKIDSLVIITDCEATGDWGDVLWPHSGNIYDFSTVDLSNYYNKAEHYEKLASATLGGKAVTSYNILTASGITAKKANENCSVISESEAGLYNIGLLTHETAHLLGLADYYSYEDASYEAVGEFDLMASTHSIPQNMLAYTRLKLGWLNYDNILHITKSGTYTLPLSMSEGRVVAKIVLNNYLQTGEYFMAELRSTSLATQDCAFDGGLSGDGLIIYRVSQESAFINSSGLPTAIDMGNMYGEDEVYVFRAGNPQSAKKLSAPFNVFSYAMLANGKVGYTLDGGYYSFDSYGNSDKSKNTSNLVSSLTSPSETVISYSNGANSGIVFSNVTLDKQTQSVTFTVELPEEEGTQKLDDATLKRLPNGKYQVRWTGGLLDDNATVMAVRSTNRLNRRAVSASLNINQESFKEQKIGLYKTLAVKQAPAVERCVTLDLLESDAEIFICIEGENGEYSYRYVGSALEDDVSFGEYLAKIFDPIYLILTVAVIALAILTPVIIMLLKNRVMPKK